MNRTFIYMGALAISCYCVGCGTMREKAGKSVVVANCSDEFQVWDIVVETLQQKTEGSIPLQIEMQGRMKWLRVWNKYCCSSRVRERWGSWFVWMFYEDGKLSYTPVAHAAARPTKTLDDCHSIYAHISVPKRGALASSSYVSVQNDMGLRPCASEDEWDAEQRREIGRYSYVEKPGMKGEVRLRVKLFRNSSLKVASRSDDVLSLSAEQCDLASVRLFIDPTREPQWEDF